MSFAQRPFVRAVARAFVVLTVVAALSVPGQALADGYESPNLYSARHVGMGTTGISFARDPSAIFHNPAGIDAEFISVIGNLSMLFTFIEGSPSANAESIRSEMTPAPLFLVGANFKIIDNLTAGIAVFPVGLAGATYYYNTQTGAPIEDTLNLLFVEISPAISYQLPAGIRIGAGYRITVALLDRLQGGRDPGVEPAVEFHASGWDFLGFRVGIQWEPIEHFSAGVVYRHKIHPTVTSDEGVRFLNLDQDSVETGLTLPSKLGFGVRGDYAGVGLAVDVEYGFHSQEQGEPVKFEGPVGELEVANNLRWTDGLTVHVGAEYEVIEGLFLRLGYIWDQNTTPAAYPSPWGTPPDDDHMLSAGAGYDWGPMSVNIAWSNRFGSGTSTPEDQEGRDSCDVCGLPGDYVVDINGAYLDFSWDF